MTREVKDRGHDASGNVVSDTQKKWEQNYLLASLLTAASMEALMRFLPMCTLAYKQHQCLHGYASKSVVTEMLTI